MIMSIEKTWRDIDEQPDEALLSLLKPKALNQLQSKNPLNTIRKNLLRNGIMGVIISCFYIFCIVSFPYWQIQTCIGAVLLFTIWATAGAFRLRNAIDGNVETLSLLEEMQRHYTNIQQWINSQKWAGLIIYPVSAAGGFMLGGVMGAEKPVDEIMAKPIMIWALLICMAVLTPIGYFLAKWLSHKAFGKHLKILKQNIDDLKEKN
jgi:hypothetical protein